MSSSKSTLDYDEILDVDYDSYDFDYHPVFSLSSSSSIGEGRDGT